MTTSTSLKSQCLDMGNKARKAAKALATADNETRSNAIRAIGERIWSNRNDILKENQKDLKAGKNKGLSNAMLDRLKLDESRIHSIAEAQKAVADLPNPLGKELERWQQPNGLVFVKTSTPIGVIGMIYESRPNVTADAASICLKSGNGCILRGGSEALFSNMSIHRCVEQGLVDVGLPKTCIQYIKTTDRAAVGYMLEGLNGTIDMIIPRGGKGLVGRVQSDARVPVLAHLEGLNHTYIHESADAKMALELVVNAKMRRTGICGATETLLVDRKARPILPDILNALLDMGCELRADTDIQDMDDRIKPANLEDFRTEYLDAILSVKFVDDIDDAIAHIAEYGSGHTDAIIAQDERAAQHFLNAVDSAIVMHNTSTQFADGGEFGFGAEIGIATGRTHARGPVGAQHLTIYKYKVLGSGQVRP